MRFRKPVICITVDTGKRREKTQILVCREIHVVNHNDGNRPSPHNELTDKENRPRGHGAHWMAKYTDDEIRTIRALHRSGLGYHKIREKMDNKTSWVSIQRIITGKTYAHVSD